MGSNDYRYKYKFLIALIDPISKKAPMSKFQITNSPLANRRAGKLQTNSKFKLLNFCNFEHLDFDIV